MSDPLRCPTKGFAIQYPGKIRNIFTAMIPADHPIDAVLSPDYFGRLLSQAGACKIGDLIQVEWEDFSKYGELQVRVIDASTEKVVTALRGDINEYGQPDLPDGWEMEFRNRTVGWAISYDGQQREAGFQTKEAAAMRIEYLARQTLRASTAKSAIKAKPAKLTSDKAPAEA